MPIVTKRKWKIICTTGGASEKENYLCGMAKKKKPVYRLEFANGTEFTVSRESAKAAPHGQSNDGWSHEAKGFCPAETSPNFADLASTDEIYLPNSRELKKATANMRKRLKKK